MAGVAFHTGCTLLKTGPNDGAEGFRQQLLPHKISKPGMQSAGDVLERNISDRIAIQLLA